jgi:hypothetical protein
MRTNVAVALACISSKFGKYAVLTRVGNSLRCAQNAGVRVGKERAEEVGVSGWVALGPIEIDRVIAVPERQRGATVMIELI